MVTGHVTYRTVRLDYFDMSPTRLFAKFNIGYSVARLGEVPIGLLLAAIAYDVLEILYFL